MRTYKRFPLLTDHRVKQGELIDLPWDMLAEHSVQAINNHHQDLHMLAERGGLSASEAVAVLENKSWKDPTIPRERAEVQARLRELLRLWNEEQADKP